MKKNKILFLSAAIVVTSMICACNYEKIKVTPEDTIMVDLQAASDFPETSANNNSNEKTPSNTEVTVNSEAFPTSEKIVELETTPEITKKIENAADKAPKTEKKAEKPKSTDSKAAEQTSQKSSEPQKPVQEVTNVQANEKTKVEEQAKTEATCVGEQCKPIETTKPAERRAVDIRVNQISPAYPGDDFKTLFQVFLVYNDGTEENLGDNFFVSLGTVCETSPGKSRTVVYALDGRFHKEMIVDIVPGKEFTIDMDFLTFVSSLDGEETICWTSSDPSVMQVFSNGDYEAYKNGTTVIRAYYVGDDGRTHYSSNSITVTTEWSDYCGGYNLSMIWSW